MNDTLDLPLTSTVNGITWSLFAIDFDTPDGTFSAHIYAISFEHANAMLFDLRANGRVERKLIGIEPGA